MGMALGKEYNSRIVFRFVALITDFLTSTFTNHLIDYIPIGKVIGCLLQVKLNE